MKLVGKVKMKAEERIQEILEHLTIDKIAIADEHQYKITQSELDRFERQLAAVDREDPNLHPRLILGRINNFQRTIDRLKQELVEYDRHKMS
ncbi:hypothetical protein [Chamaesiphon sp. VAR_48_metabat_403]|uniref:hypothetical protein n=1 Tax=Chamaesiphon sp. VAR_48_metabat_403 TaxID=2964700 RepID=UPI00286D7EBA|nr:hypothetical protein [Chamaesiphon sp. VAR_48_metabat_403]